MALLISDSYVYNAFHSQVSNNTRQHRQNRGRMNGNTISQGNAHSGTYMPQAQQTTQSVASSKESSTQEVCFFLPHSENMIPDMQ